MTGQAKPKAARIFERSGNDWYVEESWCVELLADAELFEGEILDPCCGMGTIPKVFRARGHEAIGSDLVFRGYGTGGVDVLKLTGKQTDNVVSNPPFTHTEAFVDKALTLARRKVAVIVPLKWLASARRSPLFESRWPVARILILSNRPSMLPGHLLLAGEKPGGGAIDYCWVVFVHGHKGPPTTHWLRLPTARKGGRTGPITAPDQALRRREPAGA